MEIPQVINEIASLLLFVNAGLFYIWIFGRENPKIEALPIFEQWLLRLGLSLVVLGAFYNSLYASYPPMVEIVINVGHAFIFTWASVFHYKQFVKNDRKK